MTFSTPHALHPSSAGDRGLHPLNQAPVAPIVLSSQDDVRTVVRVRYLSKALATVRFSPGTGGTFFRGICNLFGPLAARRLFRTLHHLRQEPGSVLSVLFSPSLSCLSLHGPNHGASDVAKIRFQCGEVRNVER